MYRNPIDPSSLPERSSRLVWLLWIAGTIALTLAATYGAFAVQPAEVQEKILDRWRTLSPAFRFRPEVLLATPLSVQLHVAGVVAALLAALIIFSLRKGTGLHRVLGWTFVVGMATAAVTSVTMMAEFGGGVSPLHIFTVITTVSLVLGIYNIRRGNVRAHAGNMVGLFFGGLLIAGAFAFLPGRTMWRMFFGG